MHKTTPLKWGGYSIFGQIKEITLLILSVRENLLRSI